MSLPVVLQDDADIEVEEAAVWYEEQRPGLGLEYIAAVSRIVLDIGENPERFPVKCSPITGSTTTVSDRIRESAAFPSQ